MDNNTFDIIIGGAGISGLCTAHFLKKLNPELNILILEKSERPGGAIRSMSENGFLAEWGAHGFLDNIAENKELLNDLGIYQLAQKAPLKQFVRYICTKGKLVKIPQTPPSIIKSNLLSFPAKLRVLGDLWKKPRPEEQTISQWTRHRFGKAMIPFADIAMTGTFAGDIDTLSIDAAMPGIRNLEKNFGSVFKGAIKSRKKKSSSGMPSMISFENGMEFLVKKLAEGMPVKYGMPIEGLEKVDEQWKASSGDQQFFSRQIILALPINSALTVLKPLVQPPRSSVREAIVNNVVLGFDKSANIPFGFGYLAPKTENRFALGALFSIHMFPKRAPQGLNLIEILVGGTRNPDYLHLDDEEMVNRAIEDVGRLIHLPSKPIFSKVLRPSSGIPQLELGHLKLIEYKEQLEKNYNGLHICGFGWEGIGINDMIKHAKKVAAAASQGRLSTREPAKAKPIYF